MYGVGVLVCSDSVERVCAIMLIWSSVFSVGLSVYVVWCLTLQSCIPHVYLALAVL